MHATKINYMQPLQRGIRFATRTFQRHPFLVKTVTCGIGFAFGDILTQLGTRKPGLKYDWPRTAKMAVAGWVAAGPLGYLFLLWMEKNILPKTPASRLAVSVKFSLDQVLGCVLWQAALLTISEPYRRATLRWVNSLRKPGPINKTHLL